MFGLSWAEIMVTLAVALIVLGPARLPEAARRLGLFYGRARRAMSDAQREFSNLSKADDKSPPKGDSSIERE